MRIEYKLLENYVSIIQNVERMNELTREGWRVHTFTDNLTLLEKCTQDNHTEDPELLLG